MLSPELMEERMNRIRVSANRLEKMKTMSLEEFLASQDNFAVAGCLEQVNHRLQVGR